MGRFSGGSQRNCFGVSCRIHEPVSPCRYQEDVCRFGNALLYFGVEPLDAVGIMGANAPEWAIAAMGSIVARCLVRQAATYCIDSQAHWAGTSIYRRVHVDELMVSSEYRRSTWD